MVVEANGGSHRVDSWGQGPALFCLHAGICDRRQWATLDAARWGRRVIAWDRRGFGETVAGTAPWSPVADAVAIADAVGASSGIWLGNSQGARVALDLALAHPERVEALVLVAPAVSGAPDGDDELDPALVARYEAVESGADPEALVQFETWFWLDGIGSVEGRVGGAAREAALAMNRAHLACPSPGPAVWACDTWTRLEQVRVPVVLVWGDLDLPPLLRRFDELARRLPRVTPVVLRGAAHLPNLEDLERFDREVLRALG